MVAFIAAGRARAQTRVPRVVVIVVPALPNDLVTAFERGMRDLGYVPGRNVHLDYRSAEGRPDRLPAIAAEVVKLAPDVIVSGGGGPSAREVMKATRAIPIVFPASGDPVGEGLVKSLARPGGNVTGQSILSVELAAKRLQLLRELLPRLQRVAILQDVALRMRIDQISATREAAKELGIEVDVVDVGSPEHYAAAFERVKARSEALIVLPSSAFNANRQRLIALTAQHRIVAVWEHRFFTQSGGLLSYGVDFTDVYRSTARYVDRILKGGKPADMPVERASKLELVVNLKTAQALGIAMPAPILARADELIR